MTEFVYIGKAGGCRPFSPVKKFNEDTKKVDTIIGRRFKRGIIYDVTDKEEINVLKNVPDMVDMDELVEVAHDLGLDADKYDWDELVKAVMWIKFDRQHYINANKHGSNHDIKALAPVPIYALKKGKAKKREKESEPVDEVPTVPEEEQDGIDEEALAEPEDEPAYQIPEGATKYYCTECEGNHKIDSKVGKRHLEFADEEP